MNYECTLTYISIHLFPKEPEYEQQIRKNIFFFFKNDISFRVKRQMTSCNGDIGYF